ncbi:MAG: Hpt domain-containing protein [Burkholderiaceae bacterium]
MLKTLRGGGLEEGWPRMLAAVESVRDSDIGARHAAFWHVLSTYFRGVAEGAIVLDVHGKRLLAGINLQLRRSLADDAPVADRLMRDVLFCVACAREVTDTLRPVYDAFGLEGLVPPDFESPRYGHVDARALATLQESLRAAKKGWEDLARGQLEEVAGYAKAMTQLRDTVDGANLKGASDLVSAWVELTKSVVRANARPDDRIGLEMATSLLFGEQLFASGLRNDPTMQARASEMADRLRRAMANDGSVEDMPDWLRQLSANAHERITLGAFANETMSNLREAEKHLDAYFRDSSLREPLPQAAEALGQVSAVLGLLGYEDASSAATRIATQILELSQLDGDPAPEQADIVADSLGALGFFVEGIGQPGRGRIACQFDPETGRFSVLMSSRADASPDGGRLVGDEPSAGESAQAAESAEARFDRRKRELADALDAYSKEGASESRRTDVAGALRALHQDAQLVDDAVLQQRASAALERLQAQTPADAVAIAALVGFPAQLVEAAIAAPTPEPAASAAEIDAELLEIFLAEAQEVLESISASLESLRGSRADADSMTTIRRGFHTLKGSSRMVGLSDFGEAGWAMEQVMNLWLAEERPASDELCALIDASRGIFASWLEALVSDATCRVDPAPLVHSADRFRTEAIYEPPVVANTVSSEASTPELGFATAPESTEVPPEEPDARALVADAVFDVPLESSASMLDADEQTSPEVDVGEAPTLDSEPLGFDDMAPEPSPVLESVEVDPFATLDLSGFAVEPEAEAGSAPVAGAPDAALEPEADFVESEEVELSAPAIDDPSPDSDATSLGFPALDLRFDDGMDLEACSASDIDLGVGSVADAGEDVADSSMSFESVEVEPSLLEAELPTVTSIEAAPFDALSPDPSPDAAWAIGDRSETIADGLADGLDDEPPVLSVGDAVLDGFEDAPIAEQSAEAQAPDEVKIGQRTISAPLFRIFLSESDELRATLQADLDDWQADPGRCASEPAQRAMHSLKGSSAIVGLTAVHSLGKLLERFLVRQRASALAVPKSDLDSYAALFELLSAQLHSFAALRDPSEDPAAMAEAQALVERWERAPSAPLASATGLDESAVSEEVAADDRLGVDTPDISDEADAEEAGMAERADEPESALVDELDPELLPIFVEEAQDYLPQIDQNLRAWHDRPDDRDLAQLLMRQLHTVKGSARMAGAMRLGQRVHEMETRVEAASALSSIPVSIIDELIADHDDVIEMFEVVRDPGRAQADAGKPPVSLPAAPSGPDASESVAARPKPVLVSSAGPVEAGASAAPAAPAAAVATQPMVRVRADLLDSLVNDSGEVSIARSRVDNSLTSLRQALSDLTENVGRLRSQLREMEIQAESQIQARIAQAREADNPFDPLEFDRFTRFQELTRLLAESVNDVGTVQQNATRSLNSADEEMGRQGRVLRELQQNLMRIRMVRFGALSDRLYRLVRQVGKELGKRVALDIRGANVEVDRSVLERMAAPLEHLLRNSVGHGIEMPEQRLAAAKSEAGEIALEVRQEGNEILVELRDDGAGLDLDRIRARAIEAGLLGADEAATEQQLSDMIFRAGFSTASAITEISGRRSRHGCRSIRGDRARRANRCGHGRGRGTTFSIRLPLTLAITQVVMVGVGPLRFAVPSSNVEQVLQLKPQSLAQAYGRARSTGNPAASRSTTSAR